MNNSLSQEGLNNISNYVNNEMLNKNMPNNNSKSQTNKTLNLGLLEFKLYRGVKYFIIEFLVFCIGFASYSYKDSNQIAFFLRWLLFFNFIGVVIIIGVLILFFYDSVQVKKIKKTKLYKAKEEEVLSMYN